MVIEQMRRGIVELDECSDKRILGSIYPIVEALAATAPQRLEDFDIVEYEWRDPAGAGLRLDVSFKRPAEDTAVKAVVEIGGNETGSGAIAIHIRVGTEKPRKLIPGDTLASREPSSYAERIIEELGAL